MTKFDYMRIEEWFPTFRWVETSMECADKINSYHEDYPKYVEVTDMVLKETTPVGKIFNRHLLLIHQTIFSDKSFAGKLREVNVRVGSHFPPNWQMVPTLMEELESQYYIKRECELLKWYKDFETIHPFQDGNGRVGGVIVAVYAHLLHPNKGWLAPDQ